MASIPTIAAITVALQRKIVRPSRVRVETTTGIFDDTWLPRAPGFLVTLEQNPPVFGPPNPSTPALGIPLTAITDVPSPIQSVSVSRAKLLIPLPDSPTLSPLQPDFNALWELCDKLHVTGFYPFTRRSDKPNSSAEARQFPLRAGFPEDAATGVAAPGLGAYLATLDLRAPRVPYRPRLRDGCPQPTRSYRRMRSKKDHPDRYPRYRPHHL